MINLYLAQILVQILEEDKHREVEKSQLMKIAEQARKDQTRQRLDKLACRFGLIQTC